MRTIHCTLGILAVCFALSIQAQSTNWYYEHTTRYGTFRHSAYGSKLISGPDYGAQIAEAQREGQRMTEERIRRRQAELERMRKAQYETAQPSSPTRNPPPSTYNPSPEETARRKKEKEDAEYIKYEKELPNAQNLFVQQSILRSMYTLRPKEETALRLIATYTQDGNVDAISRLWDGFSEKAKSVHRELVYAAFGSAFFRNADYRYALHYLDRLQSHDLNSFSERMYCRIKLGQWDSLKIAATKDIAAFPELSPVAPHLSNAIDMLQAGIADTSNTSMTAAAFYQFAVARRESLLMDNANLLAIDIAVRLVPQNSTYREERFNVNAVFKFKAAMDEDYRFLINN